MKLHHSVIRALAVCIATTSYTVADTTMFAAPDFAGYNSGTAGVEYTWNASTGAWERTPGRSDGKGPILIFDNVGTVSTNGVGDTSDYGGIKVTGNSNVSINAGTWGGSLYVGAGSVLNTSAGNWKNSEADGEANVYVDGTLNLTNDVYKYDKGHTDDHYWHIGAEGVINMTDIESVNKNNAKLHVELVALGNHEESGIIGRILIDNVLYEKTYIHTGAAATIGAIDTLNVWQLNDDASYTELTEATGDLTTGTYKIVDKGVSSNLTIQYLAKGYTAMDLVWTNGGGAWTEAGTNWHTEGSAEAVSFIVGDSVTFSNDGSSAEAVTVTGTVAPESMTVDGKFSFNGEGAIASTGSLVLTSGAELTLANTGGNSWESLEINAGDSGEKAESATLNLSGGKTTIGTIDASGNTLHINSTGDKRQLELGGMVHAGSLKVTGEVSLRSQEAINADISVSGTGNTVHVDQSSSLNLASGKGLTVGDGGTLKIAIYSGFEGDIKLQGGGMIAMENGASGHSHLGVAGNTITIENATEKSALVKAGANGDNTKINSNITGSGKLELDRVSSSYMNLVTVNGAISGNNLTVIYTNGHYKLNAANSYGGGTAVYGSGNGWYDTYNALEAGVEGALGTGKVTMVGDGLLKVSAAQKNSISFTTEQTDGSLIEHASLTASSTGSLSYTGGSITGKSITDMVITAGALEIMDGETLTFTNVTMDGDTIITLNALGSATFSTDVTSGALSGITLTGNLDLRLSSALVSAYASETPFSITLTGLNSSEAGDITVSGEMLAAFGALENVTKGAEATVLTFAGKGQAVPEPTTATLSLLALVGLAARRRRK